MISVWSAFQRPVTLGELLALLIVWRVLKWIWYATG